MKLRIILSFASLALCGLTGSAAAEEVCHRWHWWTDRRLLCRRTIHMQVG